MENLYIKKIVLFLLSILSVYVFILIFPYIRNTLLFILKVLIPFIISFVLAFILQPLVVVIQKKVKKRSIAVMIVIILLISLIAIVLKTTIPYSVREVKELIKNFPTILNELEEIINSFASKFDFLPIDYQPTFENINEFLSSYVIKVSELPQTILNKFANYVSIIVVIPVILIYLLLDYEKILCYIREKLVKAGKNNLKNYLGELNQKMTSYFRGSFLVMIILILVCTIAFLITKLSYPLFFACIIAVTNVIPYIGPYLGGAFPVIFAFLESPKKALVILIIVVVVQMIESNFLTPYIQSKQTENHPLLVILFLLLFGKLFGIIGMLVAVPILTILKTTLKYYPFKLLFSSKKE